jgi:hypothetical protein
VLRCLGCASAGSEDVLACHVADSASWMARQLCLPRWCCAVLCCVAKGRCAGQLKWCLVLCLAVLGCRRTVSRAAEVGLCCTMLC